MSTKKTENQIYFMPCGTPDQEFNKNLLFPHLDILEEAVVAVVENLALYSIESPLGSSDSGSIPPKTIFWLCCYVFQP